MEPENPQPADQPVVDQTARQCIKTMAAALFERMEELETANEDILKRLEDLQTCATSSHSNQARFLMEHERMLGQIDSALSTIKTSVSGLSLQVRDLRLDLKKDKPTEEHSEETKAKIQAKNVWTEERRQKLAASHRGLKASEETRKKMSERAKGRSRSEDQKSRISQSMAGKPKSEEHKRKLSEALRGRPLSEETKEKMRQARKRTTT